VNFVFQNDKRFIEKNLLTLNKAYFMTLPVLFDIPFIPIKSRNPSQDIHLAPSAQLYMSNIYNEDKPVKPLFFLKGSSRRTERGSGPFS
jgi:hypothetical protein